MMVVAAILSLLIGVTLGLLGGGGSILTVPMLTIVLGMPDKAAISLSLAVVGFTSAAASYSHARAGRVKWRTGLVFGASGVVGALGGGRLSHEVPARYLMAVFVAMMVITAVFMIRGRRSTASTEEPRVWKALLLGAGIGALTGLIGVGGGFIIVPALVLLVGLPMTAAVATSAVVITLNATAGFVAHLGASAIDWTLAAVLSIAGVIGSLIGGNLVARIDPSRLRQAFGWFVLAVAAVTLHHVVVTW
jgi:uncharacterized membrane protein YfcA